MKRISNNIKFVVCSLLLIFAFGKILSFIYPASDPNSKECPDFLIFLVILIPPFLVSKFFHFQTKTKTGSIVYLVLKFSYTCFFCLGTFIEIDEYLFNGESPWIVSLIWFLLSFFSAYFLCKKRIKELSGNPAAESDEHQPAPIVIEPVQRNQRSESPIPSLNRNRGSRNHEIYIFRKQQAHSIAKKYTVFLDGVPSGTLRNGKSILIRTTYGQHKIEFKGYFKIENSITVSITQRQTSIFTSVSWKTGKIVIDRVEQNEEDFDTAIDRTASPPIHSASLDAIDAMSGHEFEHFTADLLRELGYQNVEVTPASGDQGVDVLAEKDGIRYAFQCKCYSSDLGNTPVQEVHAGKYIYHCHVGVVITNRHFTQGAKDAAQATGILLWDREKLKEMLEAAK